jgi:hypothetical protein
MNILLTRIIMHTLIIMKFFKENTPFYANRFLWVNVQEVSDSTDTFKLILYPCPTTAFTFVSHFNENQKTVFMTRPNVKENITALMFSGNSVTLYSEIVQVSQVHGMAWHGQCSVTFLNGAH